MPPKSHTASETTGLKWTATDRTEHEDESSPGPIAVADGVLQQRAQRRPGESDLTARPEPITSAHENAEAPKLGEQSARDGGCHDGSYNSIIIVY